MAINPLLVGGGIVTTAAIVGGGLYAGGVFSSSKSPQTGDTNLRTTIKEIAWHSLSEDSDYFDPAGGTNVSTNYNNKYGQTYSRYLVGVSSAATGKTPNSNDPWWKWSYDTNYPKNDQNTHGLGKKGSSEDLKNACKEAYKAETANVKTEETGVTAATDFKESDVWKYCSPFGSKPTTVQAAGNALDGIADATTEKGYATSNDTNKFGEKLKASVISTFDPKNDKFWTFKDKEFKAGVLDGNPSTKSTYFAVTKSKSIRDLCREAYTKDVPSSTEDANTPSENNVKKYCTLTGQ